MWALLPAFNPCPARWTVPTIKSSKEGEEGEERVEEIR